MEHTINLTSSIRELKGVGDKTAGLYAQLGIMTAEDVLHYFPRSYDRLEPPVSVMEARECDFCAVRGLISSPVKILSVRGMQIVTTTLQDEAGESLQLKWFRAPWIRKTLHPGMVAVFRGRVGRQGKSISLEQPEIYSTEKYAQEAKHLRPVYSVCSGLSSRAVNKLAAQVFEKIQVIPETLPEPLLTQYGLMPLRESLYHLHFPENESQLSAARRRIVFEEFYRFICGIRHMKESLEQEKNHFAIVPHMEVDELIRKLPYDLTGAQKRVWQEIRRDMEGTYMMNRLIQGDVGSGKTILSFLALYETALCGYQGVLMAPTEVLAAQHYQSFCRLIDQYRLPLRPVLLTGSLTAGQKKNLYARIRAHDADVIIGTHALIQEKVEYDDLALVVTDEQHRFGVRQREALREKGLSPHVMVMSATPIPRTLAIILYGDFSLSVLDEMPKNRLPIKTCVVGPSYRPTAYRFLEKQIREGRQAYVICPMVEASEVMEGENVLDYGKKLRGQFPEDIRIEILHGRMKPEEKSRIMDAFASGDIQILVSTTVIEVGIDVPNANVILIENAERFGLAQLHQLRGRVGRGAQQSYCILLDTSGHEDARKRLDILNRSSDGFYIASEDMKLRGPGDFFGIRQSGSLEFVLGDIYTDSDILKQAAQAADQYGTDPSEAVLPAKHLNL